MTYGLNVEPKAETITKEAQKEKFICYIGDRISDLGAEK
jgi:hypothetical protein